MPGKRVQLDDETWNALDLLAKDRMAMFHLTDPTPLLVAGFLAFLGRRRFFEGVDFSKRALRRLLSFRRLSFPSCL
jgi:hypothetical protein